MLKDFLMVFGSILVSFFLGAGVMTLLGGLTTFKYLIVKASRGSKVLIFADTPTGRKTFIGTFAKKDKEGVITWKLYGNDKLTTYESNSDIGRYYAVNYVALNVETPEVTYNLSKLGETPVKSIDSKKYNNIYERLITKPELDNTQNKVIVLALIGLGVIVVGVGLIYFKVVNIEQVVLGLGVI